MWARPCGIFKGNYDADMLAQSFNRFFGATLIATARLGLDIPSLLITFAKEYTSEVFSDFYTV
jgi:hypothetical protein